MLVIVPHQDDEINVAGNSIQNFIHAGAEVFVLFANRGDYRVFDALGFNYYNYTSDTRLNEAAASLEVLGIDRSHIFCLGYGEILNESPAGHIFYTKISRACLHEEIWKHVAEGALRILLILCTRNTAPIVA